MPNDLAVRLNTPNLTFKELNGLLGQAKVDISFWGVRRVQVEGFEGSLALDALPRLVGRILHQAHRVGNVEHKDPQLSGLERIAGKSATVKIENLYKKSDEALKTCNCFTRVFAWFRDTFTSSFGIRSDMDLGVWGNNATYFYCYSSLEELKDFVQANEARAVQSTFDHFPPEVKDAIKNAIWLAAGSPQFGYERDFGQEIIDTDPTGALVKQAIANLLAAQETTAPRAESSRHQVVSGLPSWLFDPHALRTTTH